MREERKLYKVLVGKPEGKKPLGRPRRRWDQNELYCYGDWLGGGVEWIQLAQDIDRWRVLVNTVINLQVLEPRSHLVTYFY
jgi:hypothetical protein